VLGGAGVAWGLLHQATSPARPATRWVVPQKGFVGFVNLSRDGTRIAYTEGPFNNLRLGVRMMDQFEGKPLAGTDGSFFPVFSPDGQWILYSTIQNKVKKIPVTGGASIVLCEGNTAFGAAWGDDDTIVFSNGKSLLRVPATGGTPETLTTANAKNGETNHVHPQFLPGGQKLLFTIGTGGNFDAAKAGILDLKTKTYRAVAPAGAVTRYAPSGHLLYLRAGTLFGLPFDVKRLAVTGSEAPVVEGVSSAGPTGYADYSFSEQGLLVYIAGTAGAAAGTTLAWADRKGVTQPITAGPQQWGTGRLSPDGTRIAAGLAKGAGVDIWVYEIARGTSTRLSFEGGSDDAIWSPDGRRIVFGYVRDGKSGIYSVAADGSGKPELLLATDRRPRPTSYTPDGQTLVYTLLGGNAKPQIMVFTAGAPPHPLHETSFPEDNGQISPDGKWVAYESSESGTQEIYAQAFPGPGAKVRISLQGGSWARWSRNMRELFYWEGTPTTRLMFVEVQTTPNFKVGTPQLLFVNNSGTTWDVAPDGKRFLVELTPVSEAAGGSRMAAVTDWFDELRRRAPAKK